MAADERATVKTRVPQHQKEAWADHANDLDMSQAEFVRTMVQAGRRDFDLEALDDQTSAPNPGGNVLRNRILEQLAGESALTFDELVERLTGDIERELEQTLQELDDEGVVDVSPRGRLSLIGAHHGDR
ncbi:MAG: DUF5805 domain-containing protein [Halobacteriales archaeon]